MANERASRSFGSRQCTLSMTLGVPTLAEIAAQFELIHGLSPAVCSSLVIKVKNGGK